MTTMAMMTIVPPIAPPTPAAIPDDEDDGPARIRDVKLNVHGYLAGRNLFRCSLEIHVHQSIGKCSRQDLY